MIITRGPDFRNEGYKVNTFETRIGLLIEELGEAAQIAGKVLRFGWANFHPDDPMATPNRVRLEEELGDVIAAVQILAQYEDLDLRRVYGFADEKVKNLIAITEGS